MPAFDVSSKTRINRSIDEVRQSISDFNTWPIWSPWLCRERSAVVEYHGEPGTLGHGYSWQGEKVGSGKMEWAQLEATQLRATLTFLAPWKSKANTYFSLTAVGDSTDVEWVMNSSLPFFMFFMVAQFKAMIKMDYKRGLSMLKDYLESGEVNSSVSAEGVVSSPRTHYLGVSADTSMDDISTSMGGSFGRLMSGLSESGVVPIGPAMALYDHMDIKQERCRYTAAVPVAAEHTDTPAGLVRGQVGSARTFKVVHTGAYRHLGNAWDLAMSDMRHEKIKAAKDLAPYEIYLNDPADTPEQDLITEIYIPLR